MTPEAEAPFDLDAYLARIGYGGDRRPSAGTLAAVHEAHALAIPFENLDIFLGRPIRLDAGSLQKKLVADRRGGYCFEQNRLLQLALEELEFAVVPLAARVRFRSTSVNPRTHMLLRVEADDRPWLADVGFGGGGPLRPIPLEPGEARQHAWRFALAREGADGWVLRAPDGDAWIDLYAFTLEPHHPIDFAMANHFVSTYPDSIFVKTRIAQRVTPDRRYALRDRDLTVAGPDGPVSEAAVRDDDELLSVLAGTFGLTFPPGTRFRSPVVSP